MADITMSLDDTLELDAIVQKWEDPNNIVSDDDNNFDMSGFQTNTRVLDPQNAGTYDITINGQTLTVKVTDPIDIPASALTEDLVAWYRFEDGDARDYASSIEYPNVTWADPTAYNGTVDNATHKTNGGVTDYKSADSGAFEFDGIDDGIIIPDIGIINTPTVSLWVKWDSLNTKYLGPFDNYDGSNHKFTIHDSGGGDSGNIGILYPNGTHSFHTPSKNTWYHYAVTYNGSKIKAYVDGEKT